MSADAANLPPSSELSSERSEGLRATEPFRGDPPPEDSGVIGTRRGGNIPSLTNRATRGFAWLMLQTVATKAVGLGSEVVLAALLLTKDYGIRSNVMSIFLFANVLQEAGINHVLINRQHKLHRWANAAFWASIALGLVAGLVLALAAPLVARSYRTPELFGMMMILAVRSPINAIGSVSYAKLQIQLRYKQLAMIGFVVVCVTAGSSIILAKAGFHAYSFVWPLLLASVCRTVILWRAAPVDVKWKLQIRRWKYLTTQSGLSLLATFFLMITSQGDYIVLGRFYSTDTGRAAVVGIYYFAFNLCLQTTQFLTTNLANVLLPTFGKLQNEPERLKNAFLRATRLLAVFGVFICLLQAAVAAPMIQTLFRRPSDPIDPDKWVGAVPVLQIISLAMAMQIFNMPAMALIQAQGRFRAMVKLSVMFAAIFLAIVLLCANMGSGTIGDIWCLPLKRFLEGIFRQPVPLTVSTIVAIGVAVYNSIIGPIVLYTAIRPVGGTWRDVWPIYFWPVLTAAVSILLGMEVGHQFPKTLWANWAKLFIVPLVAVLIYTPLVRLTAPAAWDDLSARVKGLLKKKSGTGL